ncbi:MAG: pyridoxal 5'-phosphate synthase glutaminase subunit PdxT [Armatimonadota bacterium]
MMPPVIGVLALQGDFEAHANAVVAAGGRVAEVRTPEDLAACDALVLPGGESTTIGKLLVRYALMEPVRGAISAGLPVLATCAGMILLSKRIVSGEAAGGQPLIGALDIGVDRNAFGRQIDSFEVDLDLTAFDGKGTLRALFIRAPVVRDVGPEIEVLARYDGRAVLVRHGEIVAAAFHPELTGETRLHEDLVRRAARFRERCPRA